MIVVGFLALGSLVVASLVFGLLLAGGLAETVNAFWVRGWSGFFFHLPSGVLSVVVSSSSRGP